MSSLAVLFNDVLDMYQLLLQAWFYLTPIIYPKDVIASRFPWVLTLNPMYYMVEIVRLPIVEGQVPDATTLLAAVGLAIAALFLGAWSFTRRADEFAYRL